jgi:hypothetical protein
MRLARGWIKLRRREAKPGPRSDDDTEPVSVQLRYLQTLAEIGVENTTVIFAVPVDFFSGIQKLLGKPGGDL